MFGEVSREFRKEINHLNALGYQWVGDVYPIAGGHKAPSGFGGKSDERQRKFNFMAHVSQRQCRQDATIEDYEAGLVVNVPSDLVWCHWLVAGDFPADFMASSSDEDILRTLARFHKVVEAFGCDRREFHARMLLYNEQVFEEWLADYAKREGMFIESARSQVLEERAGAARSAGSVPADSQPGSSQKAPRHPFSWYESRYDQYGDEIDVIDHNWRRSGEHIRQEIARKKAEHETQRKTEVGLTISDMNAAGVTYSELKRTETYRIDSETKEIIVIRTRDGKFLRGTGKFVARLLPNGESDQKQAEKAPTTTPKAQKQAEIRPLAASSKPKCAPVTPKVAQVTKQVQNEPKTAPRTAQKRNQAKRTVVRAEKEPFDPLKGVVNPRPQDKSGWKGTRKRRSCITTRNAYDSAEGCLAIGAMLTRSVR